MMSRFITRPDREVSVVLISSPVNMLSDEESAKLDLAHAHALGNPSKSYGRTYCESGASG